jgi:CBS-domain-containing membrane protein
MTRGTLAPAHAGLREKVIAVKETKVKDVMTASVVAVRETADFKEMVTVMRSHRISAFPVIDGDSRVIGVVSEADLLLKEATPALPQGTIRLAWRLRQRSRADGTTAAEVMSTPAMTIRQDAPVAEAARLMQARRVKRLPVVDADGRLQGIVSRADLLRVYERPDTDIRHDVVKGVLIGEFGLDELMFAVTVKSGVVTIIGPVDERSVALSLLAATRYVEGVVAVRDRLSYPEDG